MSEIFKLGARLAKCAEFVPVGANLVDIGTDHGYLPIWLLKTGKIIKAVAADINKDPLESAKSNAQKYQVEIKAVLSNGFENIEPEEFDCAVIAGMGGELISSIIESAQFLKNEKYTIVLQSMSKTHKLREYLQLNGFSILKEEVLEDKSKIYSVMLVKFQKSVEKCLYMGAIENTDCLSAKYAEMVLRDLNNQLRSAKEDEKLLLNNKISEIKELYICEK